MTALLTARARPRFRVSATRQDSLFGDGEPLESPAATAPTHAAAPAPPELQPAPAAVTRTQPTLDAAIGSLWEQLVAGRTTTCPVCDAPMEPRHSASAGVVGGRCRACGSTLA